MKIQGRIGRRMAVSMFTVIAMAGIAVAAVCGTCKGSGTGSFQCFHCKGSGKNTIGHKCNFCNGRGFQKCMSCNGTGQK